MKKLFYVLAVAFIAACNNGEKTEETTTDTTTVTPVDTSMVMPPADTTMTDTSAAK